MQRYAATLRSGRSQLTLRSLRCPDRRCKLLRGAQPSIQRQRNAQDEVEQHDPNSEPVSPLQQYTQAFLQAGMKAPDTVRRVSEYVKDEPEQDSESLYMHERLVAIEHPAYPAPCLPSTCPCGDLRKLGHRKVDAVQCHLGAYNLVSNGK